MPRKAAALVALLTLALAVGAKPAPARADTHTVTWDKYSLKVDGKRLYVWSGEFHPFRLPNPDLWRDILQKMKANGYDAVSIYVDWGVHSPKPGVYDFSGVRDMDKFLDIANEVGIYVIARPGPYINAEVDAGGFPGWLTSKAGTARSNNPAYLSYVDEYLSHIDAILARHQVTDGTGPVILYQIENEYAGSNAAYMQHLYEKVRADGITVPIFHNDKGRNGLWTPGSLTTADGQPAPDLYGFDGYPGGTCSTSGNPGTAGTPPDWGYYGIGGKTGGASASPDTPGLMAEFGGGWFDPWGDKLFGGKGYPCLAVRENGAYERDYYLTALANGIKIQNIYMTFGGTNWGWLPAPVVYTSYDYGAAWDEARQPRTDKVDAMKAMGYMVQSVAPLSALDPAGAFSVTATDQNGNPDANVRVYHLASPESGTQVYLPRHATQSTSDLKFTFPISTSDGDYTIPQQGQLELKGEDMKAVVADWSFDSQHLVYSTADVMTHAALQGTDALIVQGRPGQTGETVLRYADRPDVTVLQGDGITSAWDATRGEERIDYPIGGFALVKIGGAHPLLLMIADDDAVGSLWRFDTAAGPVIVRGPELVRSASRHGAVLDLTGDTKAPSDLEVWGDGIHAVTWNGDPVPTSATSSGSRVARKRLAGAPEVDLPALTGWRYHAEAPEAQAGFDDSRWTAADHTTSNSKTKVPAGQPVLFADDYGFHNGNVWYRGSYSGAGTATQVKLSFQTGTVGLLEAWLDGHYLGSSQTPVPTSSQATTATWAQTATFDIPAGLQSDGTHKLAVLVNMMGHEEDGGANDSFRNARGLTAVTFTGSTAPIAWKIQGNQGGEDIADPVRGFVNESGLYGENAGWSLEGYPDAGWTPVTLPNSDPNPGVAWYRTTFDLDVPAGTDASLGLKISDPPAKAYRGSIYVNGWNMGQYINDVGPQHTFVLPTGILREHGRNTLAIAVTTDNAGGGDTGGGLGTVELVNLGTAASGLVVHDVDSPAFDPPKLDAVALKPHSGEAYSGPVADVTIPPDVQGAALDATIDWGDGTSSAGTIADGVVSGTHTYAHARAYKVRVSVGDRYGAAELASASENVPVLPPQAAG